MGHEGAPISIDRIIAYHVKIPMIKPFRISVGEIKEKEFVVFEARSGDTVGWGEAAVDGIPFYTSETADTALLIGKRVLAPLIKSRVWSSPEELVASMDRYRGHNFTKAAFESMLWDIYGKTRGLSLSQLISAATTKTRTWVEGRPSLGIKDSPEQLVEAATKEVERGYQKIKIKVSPGRDLEYIEAVRRAFPDLILIVDANAAYSIQEMEQIASWDAFNLLMIEQPLDRSDLYYHSELCRRMRTPICLDESIRSTHLAQCAVVMKSADIVNIKVSRVGGLVLAKRIHDICEAAHIPVCIGGRFGSGIAEAVRLAAAALPNATYPSAVGSGRDYLADELIDGWFEVRNCCKYRVPDNPGLGITMNRSKLATYTVRKEEL